MEVNYFTILYWFCHTSTWIHHRYTRVPHPESPSLFPPCTIPLGLSAPAPSISIIHWTWTGDSFHIWYYACFNAILPNHPTLSLSHRVRSWALKATDTVTFLSLVSFLCETLTFPLLSQENNNMFSISSSFHLLLTLKISDISLYWIYFW